VAKPDFKARVAGPGAQSKRTDLQGSQPIRVPTGLAYGERKSMIAAQQAVPLPSSQGPALPSGPSAPGPSPQGAPPDDMLSLLAHPNEAKEAAIPQPTSPVSLSADDLLFAVEQIISGAETVSTSTLELLNGLRREARGEMGPDLPDNSQAFMDAL